MSKFEGIDSREIKCCDKSKGTIQAGISFDNDDGKNVLKFHFLELIDCGKNGKLKEPIIHQATKSMWLCRENTKELIKALQELDFD